MNKKRYIIAFLLVIVSIFPWTLNIKAEESNQNYQIVIEDNANLLTTEEVDYLQETMQGLKKYGNIRMVIVCKV